MCRIAKDSLLRKTRFLKRAEMINHKMKTNETEEYYRDLEDDFSCNENKWWIEHEKIRKVVKNESKREKNL